MYAKAPPKKASLAKGLDEGGLKKQPLDVYTQRIEQYAASFELRRIKFEGVDDSQYLHALTYVDLKNEQFKDIDAVDVSRLRQITVALRLVSAQRSVPEDRLRRALTAEQYDDYTRSFDYDISAAESGDDSEMPWQLKSYMDKVRMGDQYTRTANMFKHSKKRDSKGKTAFGRYEAKAESCYEDAVMDLCSLIDINPTRNPVPDVALAGQVQRWLDRDVNPEPGFEPDLSIQNIPRVRGSKSKYTLVDTEPIVGARLRKHWRQREALSKAALELLYEKPEEDVLTDEQREKMRQRMRSLQAFQSND